MGRSHVRPIQQPDETTCGPVSLKHALSILGIRKSLESLIELCRTNSNGTTTRNMIRAMNKLGLSVLLVEYATLRHLKSALHHTSTKPRAVLVSYLYDTDRNDTPVDESGHWAAVSSYKSDTSRIVLFDSATAAKKSYPWLSFRERWYDFDYKRRRIGKRKLRFKLIRKWQPQLLVVVARESSHLPKFRIDSKKLFIPTAS